MAYYDNYAVPHPTIRHKCDVVIALSDEHDHCGSCSAYR